MATFTAIGIAGCTYSGGEFLYMMGFGTPPLVEAQFHLTRGPLMIFVDDPFERMDSPKTSRQLFERLSQELLKNRAAGKVVPYESMLQLRQSVPDFDRRGCRELGQMVHAEQVLWVEVQDFLAKEDLIQNTDDAAFLTVSVRVINVLEEKSRSRVRLWPSSPRGTMASAKLSGARTAELGSRDAIGEKLASELAVEVAKLFYDHRAGEFDSA